MKIRTYTFLILLLNCIVTFAQNPVWQWAKAASGSSEASVGNGIAVDNDGNTYVTGLFDVMSITLGNVTLANSGKNDVLLAKYNNAGNLLWAKRAGGPDIEYGISVAVDSAGNAFVVGGFRGATISFNNITLNNSDSLYSTSDLFIAKYDPAGNVIWAKSVGGMFDNLVSAIDIDPYGNIYMIGDYSGSISFDSITFTSTGDKDVFIVKYDNAGNILWAKNAGGARYEQLYDISVDPYGNGYLAGRFNSVTAIFDTVVLTKSDTSQYSYDFFVVKYDSLGNALWVKNINPLANSYNIAADAYGNYYQGGYFTDSVLLLDTILLTDSDNIGADIFIAKYDGSGNILWAKSAGGSWGESCQAIDTDNNGNLYITGAYGSAVLAFDTCIIVNSDNVFHRRDIFVTKYDGSGNVLWAKSAGGPTDHDSPYAIAADRDGNSYITGDFGALAVFDNTTITTNVITATLFVAKLNTNNNTGIKENSINENGWLEFFPNPSESVLYINTDLAADKYYITNLLGQTVKEGRITNKTIDISSLESNIYFLSIVDGKNKKTVTKKIVKQ